MPRRTGHGDPAAKPGGAGEFGIHVHRMPLAGEIGVTVDIVERDAARRTFQHRPGHEILEPDLHRSPSSQHFRLPIDRSKAPRKYGTAFLNLKQVEIHMATAVTDDLRLLADGVRSFVAAELQPHEDLVERLDAVPDELFREIQQKAIATGYYALNMPEEYGGGGLTSPERAVAEIEFAAPAERWRSSATARRQS
jgi:hypothetical protein